MTNEMVDRVARALLQKLIADSDDPESPFVADEGMFVVKLNGSVNLRILTRVVIRTMSEPTESMFTRGGNVKISSCERTPINSRRWGRIGDRAARDCWKAMVTIALEEK